jgi:hypothetical protein
MQQCGQHAAVHDGLQLKLGCPAGPTAEQKEDFEDRLRVFDFDSFVENNHAVEGLTMTLVDGFSNAVLRVEDRIKAARDKYHHMTHLINKKQAREAAAQQVAAGTATPDHQTRAADPLPPACVCE